MYDIIIVGAGPAGLTAAIYAMRAAKKTLILEKAAYGGQIINTLDIENYPAEPHISGFDLATKLYNQAKELGAEVKFENVTKIEELQGLKNVITDKASYEAKAVILATGSSNRKLGLENEDSLIGKGVSYCATCDGNFYKGKDVAVVGGGNTAIEDALYLSEIARTVYLIHRRDKFTADEKSVNKLKEKQNIKFILNSNVTKLVANGKLESIEITENSGMVQTIEISGIFIAIGRVPNNDSFSDLVELDDYGYIKAEEDCHTSARGIYVAGDSRAKGLRQLVTATSDGAVAATEAVKYINDNN